MANMFCREFDFAIDDKVGRVEKEVKNQKDKIYNLASLVAELGTTQVEVNNELYASIDLIEDTCDLLLEASKDLIKENNEHEKEINKWKYLTIVMGVLSVISSVTTILINFV